LKRSSNQRIGLHGRQVDSSDHSPAIIGVIVNETKSDVRVATVMTIANS
jgi:RNase P/RNase MRP subunit p29